MLLCSKIVHSERKHLNYELCSFGRYDYCNTGYRRVASRPATNPLSPPLHHYVQLLHKATTPPHLPILLAGNFFPLDTHKVHSNAVMVQPRSTVCSNKGVNSTQAAKHTNSTDANRSTNDLLLRALSAHGRAIIGKLL